MPASSAVLQVSSTASADWNIDETMIVPGAMSSWAIWLFSSSVRVTTLAGRSIWRRWPVEITCCAIRSVAFAPLAI